MTRIRQWDDPASVWTANNPVLKRGEVGWESDTRKAKKGDGVTAWNDLPYAVESAASRAPLNSPAFTGNPTAPTPSFGDNDTSIATTAFVQAALPNITNKAPLDSPVFTGDPKAPTPATADSDTSVATTAFVKNQGYAPTASPTFTGDPKAPTAAVGDNDVTIATTQFVTRERLKAARYVSSASQAIPQGALTQMDLTGTPEYENTSVFSRSGSVITVLEAGVYALEAFVTYPAGFAAPGRVFIRVERFTSEAVGAGTALAAMEFTAQYPALSAVSQGRLLAANTKLRVYVYQLAGGTANTSGSDSSSGPASGFMIRKMS